MLKTIKFIFGKFLCRVGFHNYVRGIIIASLDTYWLQGGERCSRCTSTRIDFNEASKLIQLMYKRGKDRQRTYYLAYCNGLTEMIKLYGIDYVKNKITDIENFKT